MKKMSDLIEENEFLKGALIIAIVALFVASVSQVVFIDNKLDNEQGTCLESTPITDYSTFDYDCDSWDDTVCTDNSSRYYGCDIVKGKCSSEFLS